jgi:hypothetical protein
MIGVTLYLYLILFGAVSGDGRGVVLMFRSFSIAPGRKVAFMSTILYILSVFLVSLTGVGLLGGLSFSTASLHLFPDSLVLDI